MIEMRGAVNLKNTLICFLLPILLSPLMQISFDIHSVAVEWHHLSRVGKEIAKRYIKTLLSRRD